MLQESADWLTYTIFGLDAETLSGKAVNFFIYDSIKIMLLLAVIIFAVTFIRSFLPAEKVRIFLSRRNRYAGNFLAATFGIVTPFCSCSAVPLFIGFVESGVPLPHRRTGHQRGGTGAPLGDVRIKDRLALHHLGTGDRDDRRYRHRKIRA
jgi:uncharacterized membrane protein YraQ (UPF0718 family)